ncbi:helix-turn-helix domain-containing protein [Spirochaeta cellobiosiphila]|uniref:helix-turn-helix domain-containing protein n=1 Tax=Spirochaeta cellobiosiphila TaxID=504483 RepID=UPI0004230D62|nr:helix-turn-helix domain-containing protein [Spirochaeta cellobiosiphila]
MTSKNMTIKQIYYKSFITLIVLPILIVFVITLPIIHNIIKSQSLDNIRIRQSNIKDTLVREYETMSIRLSHLVYVNNNNLLDIIASIDTKDPGERHQYEQELNKAAQLALVPVSHIIGMNIYMKSGRIINYKNEVELTEEDIRNNIIPATPSLVSNKVYVGSSNKNQEVYQGAGKSALILVAALQPDVLTDRSEKISLITMYDLSEISKLIHRYDSEEQGYTIITSGENQDQLVYAGKIDSQLLNGYLGKLSLPGYTISKTPINLKDKHLNIITITKTASLTKHFNVISTIILSVILVILLLFTVFSRMFLQNIVHPILTMWKSLKKVEEGQLDIYVEPMGCLEVSTMTHSFNSMVLRIKALIDDYENRINEQNGTPQNIFMDLIKKNISPEDIIKKNNTYFTQPFLIIGLQLKNHTKDLVKSLYQVPHFASHCLIEQFQDDYYIVHYQLQSVYNESQIIHMLHDLDSIVLKETHSNLQAILRKPLSDLTLIEEEIKILGQLKGLFEITPQKPYMILDEDQTQRLLQGIGQYKEWAHAVYLGDEKKENDQRQQFINHIETESISLARDEIVSLLLAFVQEFNKENLSLSQLLGDNKSDYIDTINNIETVTELILFINNIIRTLLDYSLKQLGQHWTDHVTLAKRYIINNYRNPELSLGVVAEYVQLNENYFATQFHQEAGETFLSYVTGLRIHKAKQLIETTNFKIYEIAHKVGYASPEHFNRVFKKEVGKSPSKWGKDLQNVKNNQ